MDAGSRLHPKWAGLRLSVKKQSPKFKDLEFFKGQVEELRFYFKFEDIKDGRLVEL